MGILMTIWKLRVAWIIILIVVIGGRFVLPGGIGSWNKTTPAFDLAECLFDLANSEQGDVRVSDSRLRQEAVSLYANRRINNPIVARAYIDDWRERSPEFVGQLGRDCADWKRRVRN